MGSKLIHEIATVEALEPPDAILVSTRDRLTRRATLGTLPFRAVGTGAVTRRLEEKLDELVSILDFGADQSGALSTLPALEAAIAAGRRHIFFPQGTYLIDRTVTLPAGTRLIGANRQTTTLRVTAATGLVCARSTAGAADWCRSTIADFTLELAQGGILCTGHECALERLRFRGGNPAHWAIIMRDANECAIRDVSMGYGGASDVFRGNGIWWDCTLTTGSGGPINYGDSTVEEVSIKLGDAGTTGIRLRPSVLPTSLVNNVFFHRIQVNAPGSSGPLAGTIGLELSQTMRSMLAVVDVEVVHTAFKVTGSIGGGNTGSSRHLTFIGCYALNCTVNYEDSNGEREGSAMRNLFLGCHGLGPLQPLTVLSSDFSARAGDGDTFLPMGLWLAEPARGAAALQLRSPNVAQLIVTSDQHDGTAETQRDGAPKNPSPRYAMLVDVRSANEARIGRPRGYRPGEQSRIALGNGPGSTAGELHRVEIKDPLVLTPRSTQPAETTDGMALYAADAGALPGGAEWYGPGYYARVPNPIAGGSIWTPWAPHSGYAQIGREQNVNWTVGVADLGKLHRVNNASARTVTVPEGLVSAEYPMAWFDLVRQGTGAVTLAVSGGAALLMPNSRTSLRRQYQGTRVYLVWNATANRTDVYAPGMYPEGQLNYEMAMENPSNPGPLPNNFLVPTNWLGRLNRVGSAVDTGVKVPTGLVPSGAGTVWFKIMKIGAGSVAIAPDTGMALKAPGDATSFVLTDTYRIATVIISGAAVSPDPNTIYIEV